MLSVSTDPAPADWLLRPGQDDSRLITIGPDGFPAYGRLRFVRDPAHPAEAEADVELAPDHPTDLLQTARALEVLAAFTSAADNCFFLFWDGYSDAPIPFWLRPRHLVALPNRAYVLWRGSLRAMATWEGSVPAFVWPADRAWCFTKDVDPHWAGVAASTAAVVALCSRGDLDVVPLRPGADLPRFA